jgi:hypothetical protein
MRKVEIAGALSHPHLHPRATRTINVRTDKRDGFVFANGKPKKQNDAERNYAQRGKN